MRGIIGLGNPGAKYRITRHNIGFLIVDHHAELNRLSFKPGKNDYYVSEGSIGPSDFFLAKPTTFMNLSGSAVQSLSHDYNIPSDELLIIYDDINLNFGQIRIRKRGSNGGHNGLRSIIYSLENNSFPRIRFGIGGEFQKGLMAEYVLSNFNQEELDYIKSRLDFTSKLINAFIIGGFTHMIDTYSALLHNQAQNE